MDGYLNVSIIKAKCQIACI